MAHTTQAEIGAVVSLWRYPVKSMIGEELQTAQVTDHGLLGDRAYALVDRADGKVATAKNPGKWPTLFACRATFLEPPRTEAPTPLLTGTFFDGATVHLLTTATLNRLRGWYPQGRFDVPRFRPNLVVESVGGEQGVVEQTWIGHTLAIGDEVRLRITGPCGRCVMTTLAQGDLPKDSAILRTAVQHTQGHVGVYAKVVQAGTIHRGDRVHMSV